jgi:hypothetical protein
LVVHTRQSAKPSAKVFKIFNTSELEKNELGTECGFAGWIAPGAGRNAGRKSGPKKYQMTENPKLTGFPDKTRASAITRDSLQNSCDASVSGLPVVIWSNLMRFCA